MTRTTKQPAPTRRKPRRNAKSAARKLKKAWPAATAVALVAIVATSAVMSSAPAISASPVTSPSVATAPAAASTHIPGSAPAPALGTSFLADAGEGSVALVTVAKGTYSGAGPDRQLLLEVTWKQVGGALDPDPSLLTVTTAAGKPAALVGEEAVETGEPGSLSDKVFRYTYTVGAGDASVTVEAKYTDKTTTFPIPS